MLVLRFPAVVDDSRLYADIAKNWLQHGVYGITNSGTIMPTLSRLPGYPAFLAVIFAIFGADNFRAVLIVQVLFDLATCFLIADMARRMFSAIAPQRLLFCWLRCARSSQITPRPHSRKRSRFSSPRLRSVSRSAVWA